MIRNIQMSQTTQSYYFLYLIQSRVNIRLGGENGLLSKLGNLSIYRVHDKTLWSIQIRQTVKLYYFLKN
jgi:hypothetical protein